MEKFVPFLTKRTKSKSFGKLIKLFWAEMAIRVPVSEGVNSLSSEFDLRIRLEPVARHATPSFL